jgi:hypothetical protein
VIHEYTRKLEVLKSSLTHMKIRILKNAVLE